MVNYRQIKTKKYIVSTKICLLDQNYSILVFLSRFIFIWIQTSIISKLIKVQDIIISSF